MIIEEIKYNMELTEKITQALGDKISQSDYYIEDMGCPHVQPSLPKGYAAVYIFVYKTKVGENISYEFLKIGKANENSNARFASQHYGFSAQSTLAKSICSDKEFVSMGINKDNVKSWMLSNLRRINIYIKADRGRAATELVEAIFHYKFRPRYEGNIGHNT